MAATPVKKMEEPADEKEYAADEKKDDEGVEKMLKAFTDKALGMLDSFDKRLAAVEKAIPSADAKKEGELDNPEGDPNADVKDNHPAPEAATKPAKAASTEVPVQKRALPKFAKKPAVAKAPAQASADVGGIIAKAVAQARADALKEVEAKLPDLIKAHGADLHLAHLSPDEREWAKNPWKTLQKYVEDERKMLGIFKTESSGGFGVKSGKGDPKRHNFYLKMANTVGWA